MITKNQLDLFNTQKTNISRVMRTIVGKLLIKIPNISDNVLGKHPLAGLTYRLALQKNNNTLQIMSILKLFSIRFNKDLSRLTENKIIGLQTNVVLPEKETRNAALDISHSIDDQSLEDSLDNYFNLCHSFMPSWWWTYITTVSSYTVVLINGKPAPPRFSGTYSDAIGAIHGTEIHDVETFIELITHEAGHLWLNLLEKASNFIQNQYSDQSYFSPWRADARPIQGVYHGAYVFSFVIPALLATKTEKSGIRAAQLAIETNDAIKQVKNYALLSREALEIIIAAEARVKDQESILINYGLSSLIEKYASLKNDKIKILKKNCPNLRVDES